MPIETLEQELKNPRLQAALASAWSSEEEAERILSALERSGLTVREFAKRTQVGAARLYSRRQQRTPPPPHIYRQVTARFRFALGGCYAYRDTGTRAKESEVASGAGVGVVE